MKPSEYDIEAAVFTHECVNCGQMFNSRRADAMTCSTRCRVALHRRYQRGDVVEVDPDRGWEARSDAYNVQWPTCSWR